MKVKVNSGNFKSLATSILPFSGGYMMPTAGAVGMTFTKNQLTIRAFAGTWAWGHVECSTEEHAEDLHIVVSGKGIEIAMLYCDDEDIILDVLEDRLLVGKATIKTLSDKTRTVGDLTPSIDINDANWVILPEQMKRVIKVSLTDNQGLGMTSLRLTPAAIIAQSKGGIHASIFCLDWDLDVRLIVPHDVAHAVARLSDEVSVCTLRDLVVFTAGDLHIATPQEGDPSTGIEADKVLLGEKCMISKPGTVSDSLLRELHVAILQSDSPDLFLWTNGGTDLYFYSADAETGSNTGFVWSSLEDFKVCVDPAYLNKLIPTGDMWKIGLFSYTADSPTVILIEEESGVVHHLMSKAMADNHGEYLQKIIDTYSKEKIDASE